MESEDGLNDENDIRQSHEAELTLKIKEIESLKTELKSSRFRIAELEVYFLALIVLILENDIHV